MPSALLLCAFHDERIMTPATSSSRCQDEFCSISRRATPPEPRHLSAEATPRAETRRQRRARLMSAISTPSAERHGETRRRAAARAFAIRHEAICASRHFARRCFTLAMSRHGFITPVFYFTFHTFAALCRFFIVLLAPPSYFGFQQRRFFMRHQPVYFFVTVSES